MCTLQSYMVFFNVLFLLSFEHYVIYGRFPSDTKKRSIRNKEWRELQSGVEVLKMGWIEKLCSRNDWLFKKIVKRKLEHKNFDQCKTTKGSPINDITSSRKEWGILWSIILKNYLKFGLILLLPGRTKKTEKTQLIKAWLGKLCSKTEGTSTFQKLKF